MTQAIVGGPLIDGTGRDPVPRGAVVIEDGRIVGAGPEAAVQIPRGACVHDAAGGTILPGFIDCHVHSTYRSRDVRQHLLAPPTYNIFRSLGVLRATLECGVTTARDLGGPLEASLSVRDRINKGEIPGPTMYVSGPFIQHAPYPGTEQFRWGVSGAADAKAKVEKTKGDVGLLDLEKNYMILVTKEGKLVTLDFDQKTKVTQITPTNSKVTDIGLGSSATVGYTKQGDKNIATNVDYTPAKGGD